MRNVLTVLAILGMFLLAAPPATADWDPGDGHKMHFPQLPDLEQTGMDVLATSPGSTGALGKILADDWLCSETGPVSDIHIWGSWLNDLLPGSATLTDPRNVQFKLSIHRDIPATPTDHSRPGEEVWQAIISPGDPRVQTRLYSQGVTEQFYDPNIDQIIGFDTQVWQYNFVFDPTKDDVFRQKEGTVYWLDVQALPGGTNDAVFGWKTSRDHWNDDAVFGDNDVFGGPPLVPPGWVDMHYPSGHTFAGESIDLAFVITPEPGTFVLAVMGLTGLLVLAWRRRRRKV